jgi:hypothetical protein
LDSSLTSEWVVSFEEVYVDRCMALVAPYDHTADRLEGLIAQGARWKIDVFALSYGELQPGARAKAGFRGWNVVELALASSW